MAILQFHPEPKGAAAPNVAEYSVRRGLTRLRDGTRRAAPGKLSAVENWHKPTNVRELRGFFGMRGFVSPYVHRCADIAAPLTDLLQEGQFVWMDAHDDAFAALKHALVANVMLHIVRFDQPFFMRCDARKNAVRAVLEQHSSESELRPVAFSPTDWAGPARALWTGPGRDFGPASPTRRARIGAHFGSYYLGA